MSTLGDKYIAGFLDADGGMAVDWQAEGARPMLRLCFGQKEEQDEVIHRIQEEIGGKIQTVTINGSRYTNLHVFQREGTMALNRIRQHLVIKRRYADVLLDLTSKRLEMPIAEAKQWLKEQRKIASLPLPKHPTRKWLAGYIDGDGCFSIRGLSKVGAASLVLHIACADFDTEGIAIIQKQFGGAIMTMCDGKCRQYVLSLNPSKAKELLAPVVGHMVVKKNQAAFVLGCAEMGHYRDGRNIKAALKQLKASPHRLNEPKPDVAVLLSAIDSHRWDKNGRFTQCLCCDTKEGKHFATGLCRPCYQTKYQVMR